MTLQTRLIKTHPLLINNGKQGAIFLTQISQIQTQETLPLFIQQQNLTTLKKLQKSVLNNTTTLDEITLTETELHDQSLQIHSCSTIIREIEVLHDSLLRALDQIQTSCAIQPHEILVVSSNISHYKHAIENIFGSASKTEFIPFNIADETFDIESSALQPFFQLLNLWQDKFTLRAGLSLLNHPVFMEKYSLTQPDIDQIEQLLKTAGVAWGINSTHVQQAPFIGHGDHTWQAGYDRLLKGLLIDTDELTNNQEVALPLANEQSDLIEVIGQFIQFITALWQQLHKPKNRLEHIQFVQSLATQLYQNKQIFDDTLNQLEQILLSLKNESIYVAEQSFSTEAFINALKESTIHHYRKQYYFDGGVQFCDLSSLRMIPFKMVCMLGMNTNQFPRQQESLGLDIMRDKPLPLDYNKTQDDRYLFIEYLCAAQDIFYLSFINTNDVEKKAKMQPSTELQLLIRWLEKTCRQSSKNQSNYYIHPSDANDPECFDPNSPYQSFAQHWLPSSNLESTASSLAKEPSVCMTEIIKVSDLMRFFKNPVRFWMHKQMHTDLNFNIDIPSPEDEAFDLDWQTKKEVQQIILAASTHSLPKSQIEQYINRHTTLINSTAKNKQIIEQFSLVENIEHHLAKINYSVEQLQQQSIDVHYPTLNGMIHGFFSAHILFSSVYMKRMAIDYYKTGYNTY